MSVKSRTVAFVVVMSFAIPAQAGIASKAIREAMEFAGKKFGREVAEEGAERLTAKLVQLGARYGDDLVATAFKKVGPRAGRIASEAGEHGGVALRLLAQHGDDALPIVSRVASLNAVARYGDDVAGTLIKHGAVGEEILERLGMQGAEALGKVGQQNGRRLAMMAADGQLKPELLSVISRFGDSACDFIYRNKGALAVGATLTAFVTSPEEFLNGTKALTEAVADATIRPIVTEAAKKTNWTALAITTVIVAGALLGAWRWKIGWVMSRLRWLIARLKDLLQPSRLKSLIQSARSRWL